jgi:hypothetical protein
VWQERKVGKTVKVKIDNDKQGRTNKHTNKTNGVLIYVPVTYKHKTTTRDQTTPFVNIYLEVLISELVAVDGLTTGSVERSKITSLAHKIRNNSVELAALKVQRLSRLTHALLA